MSTIESYSFGSMTIAVTHYTKDVIIFPDGRILSPWWRNQGHVLMSDDLQELLKAEPDVIVCGTGTMGFMRPAAELYSYLATCNIDFIVQRSPTAVETYNNLADKKRVGGCFHLTC